MSKKKSTQENKQKTITKKLTIGERIDFDQLFRIKGRQGVYTSRSDVNKSGMISMVSYSDPKKTCVVHATILMNLARLQFWSYLKDPLTINQVFSNYEAFLKSNNPEEATEDDLMNALVPGYNPDMFKHYHKKQVLSWYGEITSTLRKLEKESKKKGSKDAKAKTT